jgi:hypothetical protein
MRICTYSMSFADFALLTRSTATMSLCTLGLSARDGDRHATAMEQYRALRVTDEEIEVPQRLGAHPCRRSHAGAFPLVIVRPAVGILL